MAMPARRSAEETARLGDAIYERAIRPQVEVTHHGKVIAIDVDSGDYAVADDIIPAVECLRAQRPDAAISGDAVWLLRVRVPGAAPFRRQLSAEGRAMEGVVNANYEAVISLPLRGPAGQTQIDAVVDTGFNGFLTLPPTVVEELGLPLPGRGRAILANDSEDLFDVYDVTVLRGNQPRFVPADEADATPLVGMRLLDAHSIYVEVADGGPVVIQALA